MRWPRYGGMQHAQCCCMRLPFGVGSTSSVAACYVFSEGSVLPGGGGSLRRLLVAACGVPVVVARCGWPGCNDGIELVDLLWVSVA